MKLSGQRLVLATHNQGKLHEFRIILGSLFASYITAGELGLSEPEEIGTTFTENALLKARTARQPNTVTLSDDSGLCANALNGDPGLYSARWAGPGKDFKHAMQTVHDKLGVAKDRSAYFIAVLALITPDGTEHLFEGRVHGQITWPPRGDKGHGYDPFFVPEGESRTFAEMDQSEKNAVSHRGRALEKLVAWLQQQS